MWGRISIGSGEQSHRFSYENVCNTLQLKRCIHCRRISRPNDLKDFPGHCPLIWPQEITLASSRVGDVQKAWRECSKNRLFDVRQALQYLLPSRLQMCRARCLLLGLQRLGALLPCLSRLNAMFFPHVSPVILMLPWQRTLQFMCAQR